MADQAQRDNALLNAEDRAALTRRLDSHIAFFNSAKADDADKIAPGGQAKRAEFITDYIAKLEKEWQANPGKGTFKSTVLTSDGNFSAKFQKKLETLGDAFKAYEIERAEQAGIAANADTAQLVDASIAGPAVEIKEPTQNKDAAAQKTATEKLRSHLAALAKEFSESAPENELSDAELNALIGNYLIKRRDTVAKDTNTKASLASDASALNADGTIDPAVAKDFKEQLPHLRAEYIKSMTTPANPARNPNGFVPIAPQPGQGGNGAQTAVTPPEPSANAQPDTKDVEDPDFDFIGRKPEHVEAALNQGKTIYWTNLDFNTLVVINTIFPGFGSNPAFRSIALGCMEEENARRAELKTPKPPLNSLAEWIALRDSDPATRDTFKAKVRSQFNFFGTEANKAHGFGFKAMYLKSTGDGPQLVLQGAGEDETEFVVSKTGVHARNMPGPFRNTTAYQLGLATLSTHRLKHGASKEPVEITIGTKGFDLFGTKTLVRDMSLISTVYHAMKTDQNTELFYMDGKKRVHVGALTEKNLHPDAISEMAMIIDPKELSAAIKKYNERHGVISLEVSAPPQADDVLRSAPQAPTTAAPIIVERPDTGNDCPVDLGLRDPKKPKDPKNPPLVQKPNGRPSAPGLGPN